MGNDKGNNLDLLINQENQIKSDRQHEGRAVILDLLSIFERLHFDLIAKNEGTGFTWIKINRDGKDLEIIAKLSFGTNESFVFSISDDELGNENKVNEDHFFIFTCIAPQKSTFFVLPRQKIWKEIQAGNIPKNTADNSYSMDIVIECENGYREALLGSQRTRISSYAHNFRLIHYRTLNRPIIFSYELEEKLIESPKTDTSKLGKWIGELLKVADILSGDVGINGKIRWKRNS